MPILPLVVALINVKIKNVKLCCPALLVRTPHFSVPFGKVIFFPVHGRKFWARDF
jgi:hypothetical protein